jgi:hypothetical protein
VCSQGGKKSDSWKDLDPYPADPNPLSINQSGNFIKFKKLRRILLTINIASDYIILGFRSHIAKYPWYKKFTFLQFDGSISLVS